MKLISDLGYECVPQVGVAGFFIDIGVVHPDRPGEILMGVECDGAAYHSSRSVRDRDRLRQEILEGKGWSIHRIWSTSWFHARSAEIDRLRRAIEERLREDRARYVPPPPETVEIEEAAISVIPDRTDSLPALSAVPSLATAVAAETELQDESLDEALERYWEYNIRPEFPDRSRSILAEEAKTYIVRDKPYTEDMWFRSVPVRVRTKMDGRERQQFLEDMFELVMQYS
jgi:very-short-patch-repair endonuclease